MQEKEIVNDYLSSLNCSLTTYAAAISQTENEQLRQTFIQMRNQDEARQYAWFQKAKEKGYYKPAQPATPEEINVVKTELSQG